jgi:hypothetical protein
VEWTPPPILQPLPSAPSLEEACSQSVWPCYYLATNDYLHVLIMLLSRRLPLLDLQKTLTTRLPVKSSITVLRFVSHWTCL